MTWMGHVARMVDRKWANRVFVGRPGGNDYVEDPDVDGRIILK